EARLAIRDRGPTGPGSADRAFINLIFRDNQAPGARQKCKGDLRGSKVKRSLCPTFARCRTRTGLGSNSKVEIGSGPAPGARQKCKGDLRGVEVARTICLEVRGIHHRASHSFRTTSEKFWDYQNTEETLPNFRQKSKEI
ncbi:hypothetical protein Prudu_009284, partial [Prunus dulcis]